jgi:predicted dehydrogenase
MGRHHVRIVSQAPDVILAGLYDTDPSVMRHLSSEYGCRAYETLDELLDDVDAVTVGAPTSEHVSIGEKCLKRGKHVMMEKPLADYPDGAARLVGLAQEVGAILMVGHVERYNPVITKLLELLREDREEIVSVDARRLAPFDGSRCLDVDVLYDLLIHDIDLALEIVDSPVLRVSAAGRPVFSSQIDVAHARIEFENGSVAVFWAGKCSARKVRSLTVTTRSRYFEADTLSQSLTVHAAAELPSLEEGLCFMGDIEVKNIDITMDEPLRLELEDFFDAVRNGHPPLVDGSRALRGLNTLDLVARSIALQSEIRMDGGN